MAAEMLLSSTYHSNSLRHHPSHPERRAHSAERRSAEAVRQAVVQLLLADRRLGFDRLPFRVSFDDGSLELEGEVPTLAIKRRTVESAASHPSVVWVVDRLRVTPATWMSDAVIREHVVDSLIEEVAFHETTLRRRARGALEAVQSPPGARGEVTVSVEDGVVTLDGEVPSRAHERLASVLAWWVPGTRDVIDGLGVSSKEQDNDDEITDGVRTALEKDPFVDATQVRVETKNNVVTLRGLVWSQHERDMAENDAWYVLRVADVVNALQVADIG